MSTLNHVLDAGWGIAGAQPQPVSTTFVTNIKLILYGENGKLGL